MSVTGAIPTTKIGTHPPQNESRGERRVLLVEDQAIIALDTAARIRRNGYTVDTAASGQAALEAVESAVAASRPFHIILMDIDLGSGMDGIETAQRILAERRIPIIFLTAHAEPEFVARVRQVTRYGYVLKRSGDLILKLSMEMALDLFEAHERALLRQRQLETVIAHAPVAMMIVDKHHRVLRVNGRGESLAGMAQSDIIGGGMGSALRCIHALSHPQGCGSMPDCGHCRLRQIVKDTLEHGVSHDAEPVEVPGEFGGAAEVTRLVVSTVLIENAPHREALLSVWRPGNRPLS